MKGKVAAAVAMVVRSMVVQSSARPSSFTLYPPAYSALSSTVLSPNTQRDPRDVVVAERLDLEHEALAVGRPGAARGAQPVGRAPAHGEMAVEADRPAEPAHRRDLGRTAVRARIRRTARGSSSFRVRTSRAADCRRTARSFRRRPWPSAAATARRWPAPADRGSAAFTFSASSAVAAGLAGMAPVGGRRRRRGSPPACRSHSAACSTMPLGLVKRCEPVTTATISSLGITTMSWRCLPTAMKASRPRHDPELAAVAQVARPALTHVDVGLAHAPRSMPPAGSACLPTGRRAARDSRSSPCRAAAGRGRSRRSRCPAGRRATARPSMPSGPNSFSRA